MLTSYQKDEGASKEEFLGNNQVTILVLAPKSQKESMSKCMRGKVSTTAVGNPNLVNLITSKSKLRDKNSLNQSKLKALSNDPKVNKKYKNYRIGNRVKQAVITEEQRVIENAKW